MEYSTCRQAVLDAFRELERRSGRDTFRLQELVNEVVQLTNRYPVETIRTHIVSVMCANAPVHHANHTNDLERVGHGLYRRIEAGSRAGTPREPTSAGDIEPGNSDSGQPLNDWFWEGNVQDTFTRFLLDNGWTVISTSNTATREQGPDIVANKESDRLIVEVKGYPSDRYVSGKRAGEPKPTNPSTQARHWYAGALLKASLARDADPNSRVAMVFPDFTTFRSLVDRTTAVVRAANIEVFFVTEHGQVTSTGTGLA